jgi:hypothetical protein
MYRLARVQGPSCTVLLAPEVPHSMEITRVTVNGERVPCDREVRRGILKTPIALSLNRPQTVVIEHTGGIGIVPLVQHPAPGDSAVGMRIVGVESNDGTVVITVEGKQATRASLSLVVFDDALPPVEGAEIRWGAGPGRAELLVAFAPSEHPIVRTTIRMQLR